MRIAATLTLLSLIGGCAVVEIPVEDPADKPFAPIEGQATNERIDHGVITVAQVNPRSDIVMLPPAIEHVVWRREGQVMVNEPMTVRDKTRRPSSMKATPGPRENWALLEEDLNFDSQIGTVAMCDRTSPCEPGEACGPLIPCEREEDFACFSVKQGNYCLESQP